MTDPATRTYAETWAGRGVPMEDLAAFVTRAMAAGAPASARIHLEKEDRNVLFGLTTPGTRMSVTWAHNFAYDGKPRQVRAGGGIVDPKQIRLVGEPTTAPIDAKAHADKIIITRAEALELGLTDPWPFKPGDVLDGADGPWLDAAPEGTVVETAAGDEWMNVGTKPGDEVPTWIRGRDRTSPEILDRIAPARLALFGPLTVIRVGEDQNLPAESWPFKPGDVLDGPEDAILDWLDDAPEGTVVTDTAGAEWKYEGSCSWVGTYRTESDELADRAPLTVVSVGGHP